MDPARLQFLFTQQLEKRISPQESEELRQFLWGKENEESLKEFIGQVYDSSPEMEMSETSASEILQVILNTREKPAKVVGLSKRKHLIRLTAAAVLLWVLGTGVWYFLQKKSSVPAVPVLSQKPEEREPGRQGAILTLSNGQQIILDSAANGRLAMEGNNSIIKKGGELSYQSQGSAKEVVYNTMTTPRGRTFQLTLSDGSKIWLNAASSIRYPVSFTGMERRVEITGEVYFEVAHQYLNGSPTHKPRPFIVSVLPPLGGQGTEVQVLGTHFNINAYRDEPVIKTTLLEGKVRVKQSEAIAILKPGEQAIIAPSKEGNITLVKDVDLNQVIAWQRGLFEFNKTDLPTIMRQISRWYDVDIAFERKPSDERYGGGLSRKLPLSEVLDLLQANGVQFRWEGKKLIVIPKT